MPESQQPWRQASFALLLLLGLLLFLYRDTGMAMAAVWTRSETFAHAFLVPPISGWLIWRQRQAVIAIPPRPEFGVLLAVACAALAWLVGDLSAVNAVTQLAFVALLVLSVPAVLGMAVARVIIFPLMFLFFAVPVGEFLMPRLMGWTADFTVIALRLSGIPVFREGLQIVIPSGNWSVVEACSGIRYLIASLTVGTLFAYLNYRSTRRRMAFVMVSILVPLVANWLRAYMIVMLGHLSGNKLATGVDHLIYGWVFFGFVIMLMFIVGARWAEPDAKQPAITQVQESGVSTSHVATRKLWGAVASLGVLLAAPHIALWVLNRAETTVLVVFNAPSALAAGWQADPSGAPAFKPAFQNPSAEINASYGQQGRVVGLYLGFYRHQNYDRKLVSSSNVLVTSADAQWAEVSRASRQVVVEGKSVSLRTAELRGSALSGQASDERLLVWQIYWINGTLTASDYLAKVYSAWYRLTGRGDDSAVIIVYTPQAPAGAGEATLASFWGANYAAIHALLQKARPGQ